jgi:hypothetical protein
MNCLCKDATNKTLSMDKVCWSRKEVNYLFIDYNYYLFIELYYYIYIIIY